MLSSDLFHLYNMACVLLQPQLNKCDKSVKALILDDIELSFSLFRSCNFINLSYLTQWSYNSQLFFSFSWCIIGALFPCSLALGLDHVFLDQWKASEVTSCQFSAEALVSPVSSLLPMFHRPKLLQDPEGTQPESLTAAKPQRTSVNPQMMWKIDAYSHQLLRIGQLSHTLRAGGISLVQQSQN